MRLIARLLIFTTLVTVLAIVGASPSQANHCKAETDDFDNGGGVSAECHGVAPGNLGEVLIIDLEGRWNQYCRYLVDTGGGLPYEVGATVTILYQGPLDEAKVVSLGYDPTGEYASFIASCNHPVPGGSGVGGEFYYTVVDPIPLVDLRALAKAKIIIDDPVIETNPPFNSRFTLVNIETWLWADPAYWVAESAFEEAGFVRVDVFAEPIALRWDFSDGSFDECTDSGTIWTPGATTTDCMVEFTKSSAGELNDAFQGTATVAWEFSWELNGTDQGTFDAPFLATTNFELQVGEIQAVGS